MAEVAITQKQLGEWAIQFVMWADGAGLTFEQGIEAADQIGLEIESAAEDRDYAERENDA